MCMSACVCACVWVCVCAFAIKCEPYLCKYPTQILLKSKQLTEKALKWKNHFEYRITWNFIWHLHSCIFMWVHGYVWVCVRVHVSRFFVCGSYDKVDDYDTDADDGRWVMTLLMMWLFVEYFLQHLFCNWSCLCCTPWAIRKGWGCSCGSYCNIGARCENLRNI